MSVHTTATDWRHVLRANTLAGIRGSGKIDREVTHVRTRLRQLRIDARTFVWRAEIQHVQGSGDCHRCIRLRVWGAGKTSQALQADLLSVAWPAPWGACATDGAYPASDDVRAVISYALKYGWQPEKQGGTFALSEHEHAAGFTLPNFLLTDRLRTSESADPTLRVIRAYERRHRG
ncbi:integrase [Micromonospora profundi]|uniref:integrase n=1 Tax=Micromonospora profundi TaxID=1420889 RepID=UPI0033A3A84C